MERELRNSVPHLIAIAFLVGISIWLKGYRDFTLDEVLWPFTMAFAAFTILISVKQGKELRFNSEHRKNEALNFKAIRLTALIAGPYWFLAIGGKNPTGALAVESLLAGVIIALFCRSIFESLARVEPDL